MDRFVSRIELKPSKTQQEELRPISGYDNEPNVILLGDPGAGKSHTFRECAARSGGQLITARNFLVTPATHLAKRLFIDALDEKRGGRTDRDTVDALVEKLFDANPTHVRISCRVADWLGGSDLAALKPYFEQSGEPVVLQLDRLSRDEQVKGSRRRVSIAPPFGGTGPTGPGEGHRTGATTSAGATA